MLTAAELEALRISAIVATESVVASLPFAVLAAWLLVASRPSKT